MSGVEPDQPSLEIARRALADSGLDRRVDLREGDANALDDEHALDLVTLNVTLHETGGPEEYRNVLVPCEAGATTRRRRRRLRTPLSRYARGVPGESRVPNVRRVQLHESLVGCGTITQGQLRELLEHRECPNRILDER